ncbi:metalloprotease TldD [Candidatus Purcelliella pentastirinorum]|nr:metalloprotease TldD [Candidatus Purcelliella pentastirinorum]
MNKKSVINDILTKNKINKEDIFLILDKFKKKKIDYAEFYFQKKQDESLILEDKIIKENYYNINQGVGIRIINNEQVGFSYSNEINKKILEKSINIINNFIINKKIIKKIKYKNIPTYTRYSNINPLNQIKNKQKIDLLHNINKLAKSIDKRVKKVTVQLTGSYEKILIANTDDYKLHTDIRPLIKLSINVLVEENNKIEYGTSGGGGRLDYKYFIKKKYNGDTYANNWTYEAVRIALIRLHANESPGGKLPVVLGNGWPGILLHEAVGHGLEADFNYKNTSVFNKKIGNKIASKLCTVIDDGTIQQTRGSITIDDEGTPGQKNILIKNGILQKYLNDKLHARLTNTLPTGNARRESYAHIPLPRMTNTYMLSGKSTPEEIINSIDFGIYAVNFNGGQVDITSGQFVFSASEAYLIKKGKIFKPIKGTTLIGSGMEVMKEISMIANDLKLDSGIGTCSKDGQDIPVGVGLPTLKINKLTIGGTKLK